MEKRGSLDELWGIGKDLFASYGGGEAYLRHERAAWGKQRDKQIAAAFRRIAKSRETEAELRMRLGIGAKPDPNVQPVSANAARLTEDSEGREERLTASQVDYLLPPEGLNGR